MLEQAVKCFSHGGRRRPAATHNTLLYTCRSLHSSFWRHGAGDLVHLPASYFPALSALFEPLSTTLPQHSEPPPLLELFHPARTKLLIRRISIHGWRHWRRNLRRWNTATHLRAYAYSAHSSRAEPVPNGRVPSDALKKLQDYIVAYKSGHHQESWSAALRLYDSLNPIEQTNSLAQGLAELLASSPEASDRVKAVHLFEQVPITDRQPEVYATVIATLLTLNKLAKAIKIMEQALDSHINPRVAGADDLLAHLVANRLWQLMFQVWQRCINVFEDKNFLAQWRAAFFKSASSQPGYEARVASLLYAVQAFPNSISPEADKSLVAGLVGSVFRHGSHFGPKQNRHILSTMKQLHLTEPLMFDLAILRTLEDPTVPQNIRVKYAFDIYKDSLGDSTAGLPRRRVLHTLLDAASKGGSQVVVRHLFKDWHQRFGPPDASVAGLFMKCFAAFGDMQKVDQILQAYIERRGKPHVRLYYPALHVRALQAGPEAVREQIASMKSESGHSPDLVCWNILMHAYQRNDDLEGALYCISEILEAGITPDEYTIGTLMAVGAERGDLELLQRLFNTSDALKIPRTPIMNDCMVLALLNNDDWEKAEKFATFTTHGSTPGRCTRMWNQILTYHSLQKPPHNLSQTLRVVRTMRQERIPFSSWTISAMMRAYAIKGQTGQASRILRKVISRKAIPVNAFHYAIVMDGYANERSFEMGMRVHAEMLELCIEPNLSSKLALLKLQIGAVQNKITVDGASKPGLRSDISEELFEELTSGSDPQVYAESEPWFGSSRFNILEAYPAVYFEFLISVYGRWRAFELVHRLVARYRKKASKFHAERHEAFPLRFLSTIMNINYRQSAHDEVEKYWNLAKETAFKGSRTSDRISKSQTTAWLAPVRRMLLARHLDIYLRSLDAQGAQEKMRQAIDELLSLGFDLDSRNWNLYVQLLATRGRYIEAFLQCETRLMASFTGWESGKHGDVYDKVSRRRSAGMQYGGPLKGYYSLRRGQLEMEYATAVRLALELDKLKHEAAFDAAKDALLVELEHKAPMTSRAVSDMPKVRNPIAVHLLGRGRTSKWKGHITASQRKMRGGQGLKIKNVKLMQRQYDR